MMYFKPMDLSGEFDPTIACRGGCSRCGHEHVLPVGPAKGPALELFARLESEKRIDFHSPEPDLRLSTDYLFGRARGQMFGVLAVRRRDGRTGVLKAFSGQYNSLWEVDGWVPPLLDATRFKSDTFEDELRIKAMTRQILALPKGSPARQVLIYQRKKASQELMKRIHAMFRLPNFRGEERPLPQAVFGPGNVPTGTGECCAPKLLGYAARHDLTPLGMAEFFFGRPNASGSREHGRFYPSCLDKCARILGFMLCGLEEGND